MGVETPRDPLEASDPRHSSDAGVPAKPQEDDTVSGMVQRHLQEYGSLDASPTGEEPAEEMERPLDDREVLQIIQAALPRATDFFQQKALARLLKTYKATRNEHPEGSKYHKALYKARAAYHRPKTLNAMRRMQTKCANALFATRDVIEMSPGDESNPQNKAATAVRKELLNYRTSRKSGRNAIPWMETTLGARTDAWQTGYTVSFQSWEYERRDAGMEPLLGEGGRVLIDPRTGLPAQRRVWETLKDRPEVALIPIENCGIDPAAPWIDPAQRSSFFFIKEPMYRSAIEAAMKQGRGGDIPWRDPAKIDWSQGRTEQEPDARAVRTARGDDATDRLEDQGSAPREVSQGDFLVWRYIWFFRHGNVDYTVYTIGTRELLSDPIPTADAFPALGGQRPIVMGTDVIRPHDLYPLSNAAALLPMQEEINDQANLRIDAQRQSVFPVAKVRRGKSVDVGALARRGPATNILVEEPDDVMFETIPNGAAALFAEMDRLNNDFDETAGIFSNSSVQGQRAMNETVGGMKILAGDADAVANLELKIWTETWYERVIQQLSLLIAYYETDDRVLSICGQRAGLAEKFGINAITDDLLMAEVSTVVDIGTGANDPAEAAGRFKLATDTIIGVATIDMQLAAGGSKFRFNLQEVASEAYGGAGFKDAGERFVVIEGDQPSPEVQQLQAQLQELQAQVAAYEQGKQGEIELEREKTSGELAVVDRKAQHEMNMARMQQRAGLVGKLVDGSINAKIGDRKAGQQAQAAAAADERKAGMQREAAATQAAEAEKGRAFDASQAEAARAAEAAQMGMQGGAPAPAPAGPPMVPPAPGGEPMVPMPGDIPPEAMQPPPEAMPPELGMGGPPAPPMGGPPAPVAPPMGSAPMDGMMEEEPDPLAELTAQISAAVGQAMQQAMAAIVAQLQQQQAQQQTSNIAAMQALLAGVERANMEQTETLLRAITAPKVVDRDKTGRVIGARTVLN